MILFLRTKRLKKSLSSFRTKIFKFRRIFFKYYIKEGLTKMNASRGEITIREILENANMDFEMEYIFEGLNSSNGRPLRFDFAVFDDSGEIDFLIEYQGKQHYEASAKFGGKKGLFQ